MRDKAAAGMQAGRPGVLRWRGVANAVEMTAAVSITITEGSAETALGVIGRGTDTGMTIIGGSVTAIHRLAVLSTEGVC